MPFTVPELTAASKAVLDMFERNKPVDQVAIERPLMKALRARQKTAPGAKQYIVEQLRMTYNGNLQWYRGAGTVTYNTRQTLEQAQYPWQSAHEGLVLDEDRLAQNGITVNETGTRTADKAEMIQLTNLLVEQTEALDLSFKEGMSRSMHLDGTLATDSLVGLDALVTTAADPVAAGTQIVGTIDRFTYPVWRNQKVTGLVVGTILTNMEKLFRLQSANGAPTHYFVGGDFLDLFRDAATAANVIQRFSTVPQTGGVKVDPSITGMQFHGIELQYCPEWDDNFGGAVNPTIPWRKRAYSLNLNALKLRPLDGQDMVSRTPPRPSNQYVMYMAKTWKGALTMNNARSQSVLAIA
jgi:hypothetical protein